MVRNGGSLNQVDVDNGVNGWASPPANLFNVRGSGYFSKKQKVPSAQSLLKPLGVDLLKSNAMLHHVLSSPNNRALKALAAVQSKSQRSKSFLFAVNLQFPSKEHHSLVFYFVMEEPISSNSLLYRFIHEDDAFRDSRLKLMSRVVRGPWIVKTAVGNHSACLLGKALTCRYMKGQNYLEIDVDIGSSAVASYILHLALGSVGSLTLDMAFLIEARTDEELPERVLGAVRMAQIKMDSAVFVDSSPVDCSSAAATAATRHNISRGLSLRGHSMKTAKVDDEQTNFRRSNKCF
ncbi:hypothetical protein O6H91_Y187500 [Diphasiastrum complanatum]|nr:hypothetical protein O6H91_Y187500 [Diphasiastrum complanatum]